jgi:alpha-amylase
VRPWCLDAHRQRIIDWINAAGGLAGAFDVTTKGILHAAMERQEYWRLADCTGKPPGVLGWWPSRAVTFIENHDTGSTQGHWRFPGGKEMQGYAYILTHPGTPTVFWDHLFEFRDLHDPISDLIALRQASGRALAQMSRATSSTRSFNTRSSRETVTYDEAAISVSALDSGVHCRSAVRILKAEQSLYAAQIDERLMVKIGPGHFAPGDEWDYALSGSDYCVWRRKH